MLIDVAREEMNKALKNGDHERKSVYSSIVGALTNSVKSNKNQLLNKEQEIETISKMFKQVKETLESCPVERKDIIEKCNYEISILSNYLPKQMDEEEIHSTIKKVLYDLGIQETVSKKDKGNIMKSLMPLVKGKADGKLVNRILESYFH